MQDFQSVLDAIIRIETKIDALASRVEGIARTANKAAAQASIAAGGPKVATAAELDGERGNPEVRYEPKSWKGPSQKGKRFSDCLPEFLEELARFKDWSAGKDDEAGKAGEVDAKGYTKSGKWARVDASLARGWAERIRSRGSDIPGVDGIPF